MHSRIMPRELLRFMLNSVKVEIKGEEIIEAIKAMKKRGREAFLENLLAATSPAYLRKPETIIKPGG